MNNQHTDEQVAQEVETPRCEAERFEALEGSAIRRDCVKLNFARQLERELVAAESELLQSQDINSFLDTEFRIATKRAEKAEAENQKLREIVERYRVWATSENPTQIELDNLKQKYDELN